MAGGIDTAITPLVDFEGPGGSGPFPKHIRAHCVIIISGVNVMDMMEPYLISVTVIQKDGDIGEAHIELDDRYGRIVMPEVGEVIIIELGWPDEGTYNVFIGFTSDIESYAQKSPQGRRMKIEAKAVNLFSNVKGHYSYHWSDGEEEIPLGNVFREAGGFAGLTVMIHPQIEQKTTKYEAMQNENVMEFAKRVADKYGAVVNIQENVMTVTPKLEFFNPMGEMLPEIVARVATDGNVIAWRIKPVAARPQWQATGWQWWDRLKAKMNLEQREVPGAGQGFSFFGSATPLFTSKGLAAYAMGAQEAAEADSGTSQRKRGTGWIIIDGQPQAQVQAKVIIMGTRPGVDGTYKIIEVEHTYERGGGFQTRLEIDFPQPGTMGNYASNWDQLGQGQEGAGAAPATPDDPRLLNGRPAAQMPEDT